jgi:cytoskeleton protein RodZ
MNKKLVTAEDDKQLDELSEDMEMVGPGQILSEARKKASISVEDVAKRLKFKKNLVENIEQDIFDQKLPSTYNRGYLKSYAKLVNVDINEVLSAYDMLGVAEVQRSEMLSFSNLTEKQAEHSRLMWLTYFIAAILFGLMVLWWQQEPKPTVEENVTEIQPNLAEQVTKSDKANQAENNQLSNKELASETEQALSSIDDVDQEKNNSIVVDSSRTLLISKQAQMNSAESIIESAPPAIEISTTTFTFSGDCWVNIYDANGERIAWGIKKSGYVMNVTAEAPLKVTLGKPELAIIEFNGQLVDMSGFNAGNIAKFTLPLTL